MHPISVTKMEAVTVIRINRSEVRNAIDGATAAALRDAWLAFERDERARVGILTGGDEVFCAGADLKAFASLTAGAAAGSPGPLGFTRLFVSKPTIAAVAGYAVAGGLELACWCDLRIADETAVFGCFERRFGVPLIDGGTVRLPQIIGVGRALEMILTGRPVHAQEAHAWGLVNEVVPRGEHLGRAIELANLLASFPQSALRNDRRSVYAAFGSDLGTALEIEAHFGGDTLQSGEPEDGAEAFVDGAGRAGSFELE